MLSLSCGMQGLPLGRGHAGLPLGHGLPSNSGVSGQSVGARSQCAECAETSKFPFTKTTSPHCWECPWLGRVTLHMTMSYLWRSACPQGLVSLSVHALHPTQDDSERSSQPKGLFVMIKDIQSSAQSCLLSHTYADPTDTYF